MEAVSATEEILRKVGRPSKYDPSFCQKLIDHMSKGYSFESFSAVVDVDRDSLYEYVKVHPEFSDAKKVAFDKNLLFWEKQGIDGLYTETEYNEKGKPISGKTLNATVWIFNMKNRHQWRDRLDSEKDNINISISLADKMAKARSRAAK